MSTLAYLSVQGSMTSLGKSSNNFAAHEGLKLTIAVPSTKHASEFKSIYGKLQKFSSLPVSCDLIPLFKITSLKKDGCSICFCFFAKIISQVTPSTLTRKEKSRKEIAIFFHVHFLCF